MLCGLIFRGVAFEFRSHANRSKKAWDFAFFAGSLAASLSQGIILGAILQGIVVEERSYAGGWWDWLSPFSVLCGVALSAGYALLGACWLILKTEGEIQAKAFRHAWVLSLLTVAGLGAVSIATPFLDNGYWLRWFSWPNVVFTAPVPLLVTLTTAGLFVALRAKKELLPFLLALRWVSSVLPSASIPSSCRARSRSGMPRPRRKARAFSWSARWCWCRSSSPIPPMPIIFSAAR
jgi:cytochrome d ubiquinol oxidase subunit II